VAEDPARDTCYNPAPGQDASGIDAEVAMTLSDAAGLAILALRDRRLTTAILRALSGRSTAEDLDALPTRLPDESVLAWACRSRASILQPAWEDECRRLRHEADDQLARATTHAIVPVPFGDNRYPRLLAAISNPPPLIWVRGEPAVLSHPAIGIVGSRAATPYALEMSRRLAMDLAASGLVIVSGLARGVDAVAHRAALAAGGATVGVLGCGVDRIYPSEYTDLARDMCARGGIISEFPPGVPPLPHHFPLRNRIISGLSLAILVVEAPEKSGSLITASAAGEQGRDVMVVPGPAAGGRNRGGHLLIRDGARIIETAEDVLDELAIPADMTLNRASSIPLPELGEFTVDEVAARTGDSPGVVLAKLLELELAGQIQRIGGGRFSRVLT
jgi:DNA processing protein